MFSNRVADGVLATNPVKSVKFQQEDSEPDRVLNRDEERLYLMAASQPLQDYATVLIETGLRPEELCKLAVLDVFLKVDTPYLIVKVGKTKCAKRTVPNYERVKEISGRVLSGESQIVWLDEQAERGRNLGGRRNVEASLVAGAKSRTGTEASRRGGSRLEERTPDVAEESLRMAVDAGIRLDSLYDENGNIDYEQVQNAVNAIASGVHRIDRLAEAGERGRIKGGRLLIGASLIVASETRADTTREDRKRRNKEEDALEAYTKSQNAWIEDVEAFKRSLNYLDRGMEAQAFEDPNDPDSVIKLAPIPYVLGADSSILRFFDDKIALHNSLPDTPPYELVGFTRDLNTTGGSTFLAVLRQPYVRGEEITELAPAFVKQMQAEGFLLGYTGSRFTGNGLSVVDITDHNVIKGEDGRFYIFDPIISYANAESYRPFNVVASESLRKVPEEGDKEYLKDLTRAHTEDLTIYAESKFTNGNLELNEEAGELYRRLMGSVLNDSDAFWGITQSQKQLQRLADATEEWSAKYEELGYSDNQLKGLRELGKNIRELGTLAALLGHSSLYMVMRLRAPVRRTSSTR